MAFVPTPHTPIAADVSPRARDLARNLEKAVEEYRSRNPGLSDAEIRQALMLMGRSRAPGGPAALVALLLAGLAALGVAVFLTMGEGPAPEQSVQWVAMGIGIIAAILGVLVAIRRRGGGAP